MAKLKLLEMDSENNMIHFRKDDKIVAFDAEVAIELIADVLDDKRPMVVRCKDCKHREVQVDGVFRYEICGIRGEIINLEGFCHMGKRREDAEHKEE